MSCRAVSLSVVLVLALSSPAQAVFIDFTLDPPTGAITGAPGSTGGWGVTVRTNATNSYWILLTGSAFDVTSGYPTLGTYADLSGNYTDTITPGAHTIPLPLDLGAAPPLGAGSFTFNQVPVGLMAAGTIRFTYDYYNGAPGTATYVGSDSFDAAASVTTPEPPTYALLCLSLAIMGYAAKRNTRQVAEKTLRTGRMPRPALESKASALERAKAEALDSSRREPGPRVQLNFPWPSPSAC